ncbi:double-strand break repair helicase AddA [Hansschlegelia plantiphila]|uniref:DNA 3'-5' helicase n=1 Tax=Hansschlegelia plantiphila TaxID=374655 RepID=A0A9W6MUV4_9HYPH|nr:double-strand break repair helicase AddA [Hansschlegelia plantiphila]GLK67288.1 double-strand break repair helicase AddA [Hansschlegelia plantiphila]
MTGPSAATLERQALASDPRRSAWVSANAGSGKTYVLVQRVVRLLLAGADPSRILCLTYTKAAAANMQNRVVERLRGWATAPDDALAEEIAGLDGRTPDAARLAQARKLFARALETPGGLKIYTIHAFCGRLLHQFPFEANVAAGFSELDDRDQAELKAEARAKVLGEAADDPDGAVGRALGYLAPRFAELTIYGALDGAIAKRDALKALIADVGDVEGAARELRGLFGLDPAETEAALEASILDGGVPASEWPAFAAELREGSVSDCKLGDCFAAAERARSGADRRASYLRVFLTDKGTPRSPKTFVTAATRKAKPILALALDAEMVRISAIVPKLRAAAIVERTQALITLALAATQAYERAKSARGLLDYEDLISRARDLLSRTEAAWVLFKLDGGLDHILVDEAQDTSPDQWEIIRLLTADFLAGEGARASSDRTVFAVGDEKQSIFGFQGAEPAAFGLARRRYDAAHREAEKLFEDVRLKESFRSTTAVLAGVDAVFARAEAHQGLSSDEDAATLHTTVRPTAPGSVELWPIVTAEAAAYAEEAWDAPFDRVNPRSAVVRLAEKIAVAIRDARRDGVPYGEVLILVRQRKALFEAILRALKAKDVPVAGADRLIVGEHIAVMDLVALAQAIVTPDDDLALACALKSPLFGLDDDDLMEIAPDREGRLADALRDGPPRAAAAHDRLTRFIAEARARTPFGFFAYVLTRAKGRQAFRARLGHEVDDPLDAFLDLAQDFSRMHPPTLTGFLRWMAAAPAEIKRDLDVSSGEVRVMTVHGAKGLEAKLVILADTCGGATAGRGSPLIMLPRPHAGSGAPAIPVWAGRKDDDPAVLASARETVLARAQAEHRRLLYVAMTRAEDQLIVCGHETARPRPEGAWYDLVRDGLTARPDVERVELADGTALLRLRSGEFAKQGVLDLAAGPTPEPPAPAWLEADAPAEAAPGPPLSPSALVADDDDPHIFVAGPAAETARLRGTLLHRLLKALPEVAPERRADVAARILSGAGGSLDREAIAEIAGAALGVIADPAFSEVFAASGRGEVPIVGALRDGRPVSGRIDRLAVTAGEILVVDYKTDRTPPAAGAPVPPAYAAQLGAYAELVGAIWPDRRVRAAILWTAAPRLDVVIA